MRERGMSDERERERERHDVHNILGKCKMQCKM